MEEFLEEIRAYARAAGLSPSTVVQRAKCGGGATWHRWESGRGSPNMRTAERLRAWMREHPVADIDGDAA